MTQTQHTADRQLKRAIAAELEWTPSVNADQIGVAICDGAVTLSGQVATYPEMEAAVSAALRVRGVVAIVDAIAVRPAPEERRAGTDIARDARTALTNTPTVPSDSVTVTVHDHRVTLSEVVAWHYQRQAAQRAAASISGIAEVRNHITLDPPVMISPVEAKEKITAALVRNVRLDADRIEVTVSGTEIRLSGHVRSWSERHQAEYAGWSTPGVTHVDNRLTIDA